MVYFDQAMAEDSLELLGIAGRDTFILTDDQKDNLALMLDGVLEQLEQDEDTAV